MASSSFRIPSKTDLKKPLKDYAATKSFYQKKADLYKDLKELYADLPEGEFSTKSLSRLFNLISSWRFDDDCRDLVWSLRDLFQPLWGNIVSYHNYKTDILADFQIVYQNPKNAEALVSAINDINWMSDREIPEIVPALKTVIAQHPDQAEAIVNTVKDLLSRNYYNFSAAAICQLLKEDKIGNIVSIQRKLKYLYDCFPNRFFWLDKTKNMQAEVDLNPYIILTNKVMPFLQEQSYGLTRVVFSCVSQQPDAIEFYATLLQKLIDKKLLAESEEVFRLLNLVLAEQSNTETSFNIIFWLVDNNQIKNMSAMFMILNASTNESLFKFLQHLKDQQLLNEPNLNALYSMRRDIIPKLQDPKTFSIKEQPEFAEMFSTKGIRRINFGDVPSPRAKSLWMRERANKKPEEKESKSMLNSFISRFTM